MSVAPLQAIEARIEDFYKREGRLPALSTVRDWADYKINRKLLSATLTTVADRLLNPPASPTPTPIPTITLPAPRAPIASDWPQIPLPALVFSDLHIPAHNNEWLHHIVQQAIQMKIRRAVLVGDIFDFGHFAKWPNGSRWNAEEELEDVVAVMAWLAQYMNEVYLIPGNHDDRFANRIDRQISTSWLLKQTTLAHQGIFHVVKHHHAYLGQTWLAAHPRTYSRSPGQPALDLAKAYNRNVAVGHTHHFNIARYFGRWAVEIGMTGDERRLEYKHKELTTHPSSELGALIILENEKPVFLHPHIG